MARAQGLGRAVNPSSPSLPWAALRWGWVARGPCGAGGVLRGRRTYPVGVTEIGPGGARGAEGGLAPGAIRATVLLGEGTPPAARRDHCRAGEVIVALTGRRTYPSAVAAGAGRASVPGGQFQAFVWMDGGWAGASVYTNGATSNRGAAYGRTARGGTSGSRGVVAVGTSCLRPVLYRG